MAQLDWVQILFDEIRDEDQAIEKKQPLYKRLSMLLVMIPLAWILTNVCKLGYREGRKIDLTYNLPKNSFIKKLLKSGCLRLRSNQHCCQNIPSEKQYQTKGINIKTLSHLGVLSNLIALQSLAN